MKYLYLILLLSITVLNGCGSGVEKGCLDDGDCTGKVCIKSICKVDPCNGVECGNGGVCKLTPDEERTPICDCPSPYSTNPNDNSQCILLPDDCVSNSNCSDGKICNTTTNKCIANPCQGYETCDGKGTCKANANSDFKAFCECTYDWYEANNDSLKCELKDNRCESDSDCAEMCNTTTHFCVENPCENNETCGGHGICEINQTTFKAFCTCENGYVANNNLLKCEYDDKCADVNCENWQSCKPETGTCETSEGRCATNVNCSEWEICNNNHYCEVNTANNRCNNIDGRDCDTFEICDVNTHFCELKPNMCAVESDCSDWKDCINNNCVLNQNKCDTNSDCGAVFKECDLTNHTCKLKTNMCSETSDCASDKYCDDLHYCSSVCNNQLCSGLGTCVGVNHNATCDCNDNYTAVGLTCVSMCQNVTCDSWEHCVAENNQANCVLNTERCETNTNCEEWKICDTGTHNCVINTVGNRCETTENCDSWELCNTTTHICEKKLNMCGVESDCDNWEDCNLTSHICEPNPTRCNIDNDCSVLWKECNLETHTCRLKANMCDDTEDCSADKSCDSSHYCVNVCNGITCSGLGTCEGVNHNPTCDCDSGYEANGLTCVDIDECQRNTDGCPLLCVNNTGSFVCTECVDDETRYSNCSNNENHLVLQPQLCFNGTWQNNGVCENTIVTTTWGSSDSAVYDSPSSSNKIILIDGDYVYINTASGGGNLSQPISSIIKLNKLDLSFIKHFQIPLSHISSGIIKVGTSIYMAGTALSNFIPEFNSTDYQVGSVDGYIVPIDLNLTTVGTVQNIAPNSNPSERVIRMDKGLNGDIYTTGDYQPATAMFLAKYNTVNNTKKITSLASDYSVGSAQGISVLYYDENNIYLLGQSTKNISGATGRKDKQDVVIAKYTSSLTTPTWIKFYGTSEDDTITDSTIDNSGNLYVTGATYGQFEGNVSKGNSDIFLAKIDSAGTVICSNQIGSISEDSQPTITYSNGFIYVAGYTTNVMEYKNGENNISYGAKDGFLAKFNALNCSHIWTKQFGGNHDEVVRSINVDSDGNIYVVGGTNSDFYGIATSGNTDTFIVKFKKEYLDK